VASALGNERVQHRRVAQATLKSQMLGKPRTRPNGLCHYEFEMPGTTRMSDATWKANLRANQKPPSPDWTKSYLVPAPFTVPPGYN
jgi:hypothetical protein